MTPAGLDGPGPSETRFAFAQIDARDEARIVELWGRPPLNLYRILAHQPQILRAWTEWNNELRHGCALPRALREIIFLQSALLQNADYEWAQHLPMARNAGLTEDKIAAIRTGGTREFDEPERAVLRATNEITDGGLSDGAFAEMQGCFSAAEMIEIIVTASHACMLGRVIRAIGVTAQSEEIASSPHQEEK